jgi:hypothetical protein
MSSRLLEASLLAVAVALTCGHDSAHACSIRKPESLQIVANPADTSAPNVPVVSVASLQRGVLHADDGCGSGSGSDEDVYGCEGNLQLVLQVSASDDTTPVNELGYLIESDEPISEAAGPLLADASGQLRLLLSIDDTGEDDLRRDLRVFAVDKAGNMSSAPALVSIRDEGKSKDKGCQIAGHAASGALWSALLLAVLLGPRLLRRTSH